MAQTKMRDAAQPELLPAETTDVPAKPPKTAARPAESRAVAKVEPPKQAQNLLSSVMTAISNPKVNPDKMNALLDVRKRVMMEQAEVEFTQAFVKMHAKLPRIDKDGRLDQGTTRSGRQGVSARYATYENINDKCSPILAEHGFSLMLLPDNPPPGQPGIVIRAKLSYVCSTDYGEIVYSEHCTIPVPPEVSGGKNAAQGVGSALAYGYRYAVIALLRIVSYAPLDRDDDSKAAGRMAREAKEGPKEISVLTQKQVADLRKAIEDCGATEAMFCQRFEIERLEDLPPTQFGEAKQACEAFSRRATAKKGADNGASSHQG